MNLFLNKNKVYDPALNICCYETKFLFLVDFVQVPGCVWVRVLLTCRTRDGLMVSQIITTATKIAPKAGLLAGTI